MELGSRVQPDAAHQLLQQQLRERHNPVSSVFASVCSTQVLRFIADPGSFLVQIPARCFRIPIFSGHRRVGRPERRYQRCRDSAAFRPRSHSEVRRRSGKGQRAFYLTPGLKTLIRHSRRSRSGGSHREVARSLSWSHRKPGGSQPSSGTPLFTLELLFHTLMLPFLADRPSQARLTLLLNLFAILPSFRSVPPSIRTSETDAPFEETIRDIYEARKLLAFC